MGKVYQFPRRVELEGEIRRRERSIKRAKKILRDGQPPRSDLHAHSIWIASPIMLEIGEEGLAKAQAELAMLDADDTLQYGGKLYRAERPAAGAN